MSAPETLFVYRLGRYKSECHARCIICDPYYSTDWQSSASHRGFNLNTGSALSFRTVLVESTDADVGPASVYASEPCITALSGFDAIAIMKAQNGNYIILDPAVDACPPFFISTVNPSTPVRRRIQCEFTNSNVFNLPEVREYGRRQQAQSRDRWDAMLVPQWDDAYMRIPEGAWFPVQLDDGRNEAAGVYSIVEWMPNDHAILDIVCCDRMVEIQPGCQLRRRLRQAIGEMVSLDIGIVRKVAD